MRWFSGDETAGDNANPVANPTGPVASGDPITGPTPIPTSTGPCPSPTSADGLETNTTDTSFPRGSGSTTTVCPPVEDPLASNVLFPGHLPALTDCGEPGVPLINLGDTATLPDGHHYACIAVSSTMTATIGLKSTHGGTEDEPDLRFTLHRFDALGYPLAVEFADDTVGTDPRLTLELEAGTYLVDLDAFGAATGVVEVYSQTP